MHGESGVDMDIRCECGDPDAGCLLISHSLISVCADIRLEDSAVYLHVFAFIALSGHPGG